VKAEYLPIDDVLPEFLRTVTTASNIILHAPPGAGKTTRIPLSLLEIIPPEAGRIVILEPRRLAAVYAARWMARLLNEEVGQTIGYSIRFDSRTSAATRVEVVTEGILTRRIQNDPILEGVAMVIFDEFHERSIHADLGLALCLDVQRHVRPELKLLVMSATLDCQSLARLLGDAPVISSAGRMHPVEVRYLEDRHQGPFLPRVVAAIRQAAAQTTGDILVFLPGSGEIRSCAALLVEAGFSDHGCAIHPLYGDLPFEEQQAALRQGLQRKIVLATSIAETSLTIEGVRTVIDCGLSRRLRHDRASGMNRLVTVRESVSSAEQRSGRAGRVAPGVCYRLFSRHTFQAMTPHSPPEIMESDLTPLVLELAAWGVREPSSLSWLDAPPESSISAARKLLSELNALDSVGRISPLGRSMANMPLHPRLARLLVRSQELGCPGLGCCLAALLSERDIIRRMAPGGHHGKYTVDVSDRVDLLQQWLAKGSTSGIADSGALKAVERVVRQLARLLGISANSLKTAGDPSLVSRLLLAAYPDRIAQQREGDQKRYLLSSGRGVRCSATGICPSGNLLVAVSVDGGDQSEGVIHLAEPVFEAVLRSEAPALIRVQERIAWDSREGRAIAVREECLGALRLTSTSFMPKQEQLLPVILDAVRASSLNLLTRDEAFLQLQARILLLGRIFPEDGWPNVSDTALMDSLETWLAQFLGGARTAQQIQAVNASSALLGLLDYRKRAALDELAPTHLAVPSGSRIKLDYCAGDLPVLAVKLQELFGLSDTPLIARGRIGVLLHLLSPAGRPLQVTRDLKGFWDGSYHEVKKEMKGRYPKHPWPDDPWSAPPTRRLKPKGT